MIKKKLKFAFIFFLYFFVKVPIVFILFVSVSIILFSKWDYYSADKIFIKEVVLVEDGFMVEVEGSSKACDDVQDFLFRSEAGFELSFERYYDHSIYVEIFMTETGAKYFLKYREMIQDEYYEKGPHFMFNEEYKLHINLGRNSLSSEIFIENKTDNRKRLIDFERINPMDFEITVLEQKYNI